MNKLEDLTNMVFGALLVLNRADDYISKNGKHQTMWHCKCLNCGKELDIRKSSLYGKKGNRTRSCGCAKTKLISEQNKMLNIYNLSGEFGVGYTNKNEEFYFDLDDYDKIKDYCWHITDKGYVENGKNIKMHKIIMGDIWIDHKDRNKRNNRKDNLRKCTRSQNSRNRDKGSNNTSGHKGVKLFKNKDWMACVRKNGKSYCKYFSINKYGYKEAYRLACEAQEMLDLELFEEFSIYNGRINNG